MSATVTVDRTSKLTVHEAPNKDSDDVKQEDLSGRNYIRWDSEGVEKIPEDEEDDSCRTDQPDSEGSMERPSPLLQRYPCSYTWNCQGLVRRS